MAGIRIDTEKIDLLSLDVRAIVPNFGLIYPLNHQNEGYQDMGIFYIDNKDNELKLLRIERGGPILMGAANSVWGKKTLRIPVVDSSELDIVNFLLQSVTEKKRFPRDEFYESSRQFVATNAFGRLETEINSLSDYLKQIQ